MLTAAMEVPAQEYVATVWRRHDDLLDGPQLEVVGGEPELVKHNRPYFRDAGAYLRLARLY